MDRMSRKELRLWVVFGKWLALACKGVKPGDHASGAVASPAVPGGTAGLFRAYSAGGRMVAMLREWLFISIGMQRRRRSVKL